MPGERKCQAVLLTVMTRKRKVILCVVTASILLIFCTDMIFLPSNLSTSTADSMSHTKPAKLMTAQLARHINTPIMHAPVKHVLILSSVGRSGSSFLGDILASQRNNVYFYEPIRYLGSERWRNRSIVVDTLKNTFHCRYSDEIFTQSKKSTATFRHPYTQRYKNVSRINLKHARDLCLQSPLIIIKTIRTRLEWARELLEDPTLNLHVIHLVRDPRGTLYSMENYVKWEKEEDEVCGYIQQDLNYKENIKRLFPNKYLLVRYEDVCKAPWVKISEIFRKFLNNDNHISKQSSDLPKGIKRYLTYHLHPPPFVHRPVGQRSPYTTYRDTSSVYQQWRWLIGQEQLSQIENVCGNILATLNYTMFSTVQNTRNKSLSIFV